MGLVHLVDIQSPAFCRYPSPNWFYPHTAPWPSPGHTTTTFMTRRHITTIPTVPPHIIRIIGATTPIRPTQQTTWTSHRQNWGLVPSTDTLRPTMGDITHTGGACQGSCRSVSVMSE